MFELAVICAGLMVFFYLIREPQKWRRPSYFFKLILNRLSGRR